MKQNYFLNFLLVTVFFSLTSIQTFGQTGTIQGLIMDQNGIYVPGANVSIEAIRKGDITDFDGKFIILGVPVGEQLLKVSYIGYKDIIKNIKYFYDKEDP